MVGTKPGCYNGNFDMLCFKVRNNLEFLDYERKNKSQDNFIACIIATIMMSLPPICDLIYNREWWVVLYTIVYIGIILELSYMLCYTNEDFLDVERLL